MGWTVLSVVGTSVDMSLESGNNKVTLHNSLLNDVEADHNQTKMRDLDRIEVTK